jgi:hypothetical protein
MWEGSRDRRRFFDCLAISSGRTARYELPMSTRRASANEQTIRVAKMVEDDLALVLGSIDVVSLLYAYFHAIVYVSTG